MSKIRDWLVGSHLAASLPEGKARALRITAVFQVVMFIFPSLLLLQAYAVDPPETRLSSTINVLSTLGLIVVARILLLNRFYALSAALTCFGVNVHLLLLVVVFPDEPAYLAFLIMAMLPLLIIPPQHRIPRWGLVLFPSVLFLAHQYFYRVHGGSGLLGPPQWIVPAENLMPQLVTILCLLIVVVYQFVRAVDKAEAKLAEEHEKSEKLLANILPRTVAAELKEAGQAKPRHYPAATVCFTDFKGFTQIA